MTNVHPESRREFQLERMILFSDAVFAIAITLLIIEVKVPEIHGTGLSESALVSAVAHLLPKLAGFFISFMLIGMYWTRHHFLFGFVVDHTPALIWLNLLFLLSIVLMPFSTGIFGEYSVPSAIHLKTPVIIYVANVCFSGLMLFLLWRYIGNPDNGVADPSLHPSIVRDAKLRAGLVTLVFALTVGVAFVNPYVARYFPIIIPIILRITKRVSARSTAQEG